MGGKLELGLTKNGTLHPREKEARIILSHIRAQGHPYIELRENGKKFIYFCVLCLAPCYSDSVVYDHLKGKLHRKRLDSARDTMLKRNPWPFSDGLIFFYASTENEKKTENANVIQNRLLKMTESENHNSLAIVPFGVEAQSDAQPIATDDTISDGSVLVIPRLKIATEAIDVHVRKVGLGKISARFVEKYGSLNGSEIRRIWCEWLGKEDSQEDDVEVQEHDFAVVVFPYSYDLGRDKVLEDTKPLLPSASMVELENGREIGRKRKAPLSDPEDVSEFFRKHYASSAEESPPLRNAPSTSALDQSNSQLLRTKFVSNRATRKAMRRRERLAAEKVCNICQQNMIPGKDVATFFNLRTGRVACCSRNPTGAFHVFHTACVIHWILLCEYEIITNRIVNQNGSQEGKIKTVSGSGKEDRDIKHVFCPECQGAGVIIADELEHPKFCSLSQMFRLKLKIILQRKEWIKNSEDLPNCSIGFDFPMEYEEIAEEKVEPLKLLQFYRADDERVVN
ncbi:unnamed protein product [Lathyrus oleraceus]|uniref:C2H2-type domain-containing protein n=1 Tax=Pisum sativum TaxID=3888 RepID=A0A9D4X3C8_PEA|nr:uncharacterized protein LOC127086876 [Pisum sativum]KAI5412908.1 hypothetical protein KIW84_057510 [Pisum sativum]